LGKSILIVEDDRYLNQTIQEVLENEGYDTEIGESAKDAINRINENGKSFGLLLLDYNLNDRRGINGLDIFEMAKKINPGIKGVMISAYGEKFIRDKCISKGIYKFIDKPFLISDLVETVNGLVVPPKN
jgi:DNA-binding NtrC family response regulator